MKPAASTPRPQPISPPPSQSRRRPVSLAGWDLMRDETLPGSGPLPLVMRPATAGVDAVAWIAAHRDTIDQRLLGAGAILFRDVGVDSPAAFRAFAEACAPSLIEYRERSSPRTEVADRIYTSTDYPPDQRIFPHNEHSYATRFPLRLFFGCLQPATSGGMTPLADCRKVTQRIAPEIRERFGRLGWLLVRNFGDGFGVPWTAAFQTSSRAVVEETCRGQGIAVEWRDGDRLRTRQVRPALTRHPKTGERLWFNHATFFHVSTLEPGLRAGVQSAFAEADLPTNTYYGDGTPIEPDVLDHLRHAYEQELVSFTWEQGDVLMLDNMLTAHARAPFSGPRRVLCAMGEPHERSDG